MRNDFDKNVFFSRHTANYPIVRKVVHVENECFYPLHHAFGIHEQQQYGHVSRNLAVRSSQFWARETILEKISLSLWAWGINSAGKFSMVLFIARINFYYRVVEVIDV